MGYNLSETAFNKVKPILDELIDLNNGNIWKQSFKDNYKAARLIRQGFEYCTKNDVGERYAKLKQNIRIRVTNDYVLAERKFEALTPVQNNIEPVRFKSFEGLTTFNEALTTFLANKQLSELGFPDFTEFDKVPIMDKVCRENGYITHIEYDEAEGQPYALWIYKNAESGKEKEHTD
jgi:hypothetical protein